MTRILILLLAAAPAFAVLPASAQDAAPAGRAEQMRERLDKRFAAADANGDGKLARDEAAAKMPRLAGNFDAIDTGRTGFVSKAQIEAYLKRQAGQRRPGAARQGT